MNEPHIILGGIPTPTRPGLERVARAIAVHHGRDPDAEVHGPDGALMPIWRAYVADAKVAIDAMWEPTSEMLVAGAREHERRGRMDRLDPARDDSFRPVWQAMIRKALEQ